jgi:integrase/recombinase XerD
LKRRKRGIVRQVPLPRDALRELNRFFKLRVMQRDPSLPPSGFGHGPHDRLAARKKGHGGGWHLRHACMPRGLRHAFGANAFQSNVPPHLVQRWMGHATSIYGDMIGPEGRAIAARMWK